jgi:hypothetical protein
MDEFTAAGVLFTNGSHILGGYQPHKKHPCISGIGGAKHDHETFIQTALRECMEELFEIKTIPKSLFTKLKSITPKTIIHSNKYINLVYSFDDLELFLKYCKSYGLKSPLYTIFPKSIHELILNRSVTESAELSHLVLLPMLPTISIDSYFQADIQLLFTMKT